MKRYFIIDLENSPLKIEKINIEDFKADGSSSITGYDTLLCNNREIGNSEIYYRCFLNFKNSIIKKINEMKSNNNNYNVNEDKLDEDNN